MSESAPGPFVVESRASDAVERCTVQKPSDLLLLPATSTSVDNHRPGMEVVVGDGNSLTKALGFVARTAALMPTVNSAEAGHITVDSLKDVNLSASRPFRSLAEGITKHPEGRPHALLTS